MIPRDKLDRLLAVRAAAPETITLVDAGEIRDTKTDDVWQAPLGPVRVASPEASAFYDEAYSSMAVLIDETVATRKAAMVVLAAIGVVNDESAVHELRAAVAKLLEEDQRASARWLEIYKAGAK